MTDSMTPTPVTSSPDLRPLEDLIARVPSELLAAESSQAEAIDELEHDFLTDPCHFLRRACQTADYGSDELRA